MLLLESLVCCHLQDIRETALVAIHLLLILVGLDVIVDVVAERAMAGNAQLPLLVSKLSVQAKVRLRQSTLISITCLCRRYRAIRLNILSLDRLAFLVVSLLCQIECVRAFAHHETFNKFTSTRNSTRLHIRALAIRHVQLCNLRIIPGVVHSYRPCEILCVDWYSINREFHTFIIHLANVGSQDSRIVHTRNHRNRVQQIFGMAFVDINRTINAVVEKSIIQTGIPGLGSLPFYVSVISVWTISVMPFVTKEIA